MFAVQRLEIPRVALVQAQTLAPAAPRLRLRGTAARGVVRRPSRSIRDRAVERDRRGARPGRARGAFVVLRDRDGDGGRGGGGAQGGGGGGPSHPRAGRGGGRRGAD